VSIRERNAVYANVADGLMKYPSYQHDVQGNANCHCGLALHIIINVNATGY